jgi:hypothetical protein
MSDCSPPTVIRVDSEGEATIVAGTPVPGHSRGLNFIASAAESAPTEVEAKAVVRRFLDRYLNYTPATVDRQMAEALNMMTGNFKALVLSRLRDEDTINLGGHLKSGQLGSLQNRPVVNHHPGQ